MNTETFESQISRVRALRGAAAIVATVAFFGALALVLSGTASAAVGPTDLVLTKTDSPDPVVQGNNLTYTIQVRNDGANDASAVVVTDTLHKDVDYVSSSTTAGTCNQAAGTVTCNLGQVNTAVTVTVTIVVKTKKSGSISNTASVASIDDTNNANNQDTEATLVNKKGATGKKPKPSCATPTISGTAGNDTLVGTSGADVIRAFGGNDVVFGNGGKDLICADLGADRVIGGPGGDTVIGGGGPDRLFGGDGGDVLKGKAGKDRLRGQAGNDGLYGGRGRDSCKGGAGRDLLRSCP
jgi:uncharacterized repeat protein (TIGR01451 family)